jgi:hypothetical protein
MWDPFSFLITNVMLKNEKQTMNFFLLQNMMLYIKRDLSFYFPPSYDQFIIQYQVLILN